MIDPLRRAVILVAMTIVGASCTDRTPPAKLVVGVSALRISLPLFLADQRGLWKQHGLDVELRSYPTAQPMVDDVVLGHLDAGGFAAYPIVFLAAQGAAHPPRMAASLVEDRAHRLSYVLARTGRGLRFPDGARGRKIGILPTVAYQRWLQAILRAAKIDPAEVTVVPLAPPMQAQALAEGGVDLLFTSDPMATAILAAGGAEIVDDGPPCAARLGDPFAFGGFVLSGPLAEQRTAVAARLVAALDEAIALVRADPAAARRAMVKWLRPEEQAFIDRYPDARYLSSAEAGAVPLDDELARERRLGILDQASPSMVRSWAPAPTP